MNHPARKTRFRRLPLVASILGIISLAATAPAWLPIAQGIADKVIGSQRAATVDDRGHGHDTAAHTTQAADSHAGHDHAGHDHAAHDDGSSLELSAQAKRNLGLTDDYIDILRLSNYRRFVTVPAIVTARPGRTQVHVSTPLNGVITHVHAVTGESILPGSLLVEVRLTHEDLVQSQTDFLKALGELDVETREMARLKAAAKSGALSDRTLLERQYAIDKLQSLLTAQTEALRLHGLSERQVQEIQSSRKLLRELRIYAPQIDEHDHDDELHLADDGMIPVSLSPRAMSFSRTKTRRVDENGLLPGADQKQQSTSPEVSGQSDDDSQSHADDQTPLLIEQLNVYKGQAVTAGDLLCTVADYSRLYIEGQAFEQDVEALNHAAASHWPLTAVFDTGKTDTQVSGLMLSFVSNIVDQESRTLSFYVDLPNVMLQDQINEERQRFVSWKYRPGQRLQLRVPVEEWIDQIVLPVEAVTREGAEAFIFRQYGDHFDRVPVHVVYSDQQAVVIANDGSVKPGAVVALRAAHQMQMALKIKAGGGADPHAGHSH